jgi:hypothetical protein
MDPPQTKPKPRLRVLRVLRRCGLTLVCVYLGAALFAPWLCRLGARRHYEGDLAAQAALARGVSRWVEGQVDQASFATGSARFDGEWMFVTYMMAGLGFGQTALEHPELRERHRPLTEICIERLLQPEARTFDARAWGEDPLDSLDGANGHMGYLGYLNLLLSHHRVLDPGHPQAALNDRITATLARRLEASEHLLLETYPGEVYPVDNMTGLASIALHARATGAPRPPLLDRWVAKVRSTYLDPKTGLLIQAVDSRTGAARDAPRGSGSAFAVYLLSFIDPKLSRDLHDAIRSHLADTFLGFGVVREYPATVEAGPGDVDSGPVILGYSVSATGFALAGARIHRDPELFGDLYATAHLFGGPYEDEGRLNFAAGGPLGDALLFALMSAQRVPE